jgi:hypothetical protein
MAEPYFRLHTPLIEPDGPVSGIRLLNKGSRCRPRESARPPGEAHEAHRFVQGGIRKPFGRRPSQALPRTAVDHIHQVRPAHCSTRSDLRHVYLPDLIRLSCFHAAPLFFRHAHRRREGTSNPRSRITRNIRLRFTRSLFFRKMGDALQFLGAAKVWEWYTNFPHQGTEHVQWEEDELFFSHPEVNCIQIEYAPRLERLPFLLVLSPHSGKALRQQP